MSTVSKTRSALNAQFILSLLIVGTTAVSAFAMAQSSINTQAVAIAKLEDRTKNLEDKWSGIDVRLARIEEGVKFLRERSR